MQLSSFWKPEDEILSFHQVQTPRSRIGYCKLELNLIQLIKRHYSFNVMCPRARPDVWNERVHLLNWKPTLASTHKYTHTHTPTQQKTFWSLFVPTLGEATTTTTTTTTTYSPTKTSFNLQMHVCMGTILFLASTIHKSKDPLKEVVG
jgi:hypothetical protein